MVSETAGLPTSRYFRLERVADGVYAAIVVPGTGAWGNAGIVDLGDATLVIDTFLTLSAARDLRAAAEALTGRPVSYVVNTHYHLDHVLGNQVFDGTLITSTEKTRDLMATRNVAELTDLRERPEELKKLEAAARRERDALTTLSEYRALVAELTALEPRLPDITFEERLTLHGSARTAEVLTYGGGHTPSDAFVYLPGERIAFMGDLWLMQTHPWMGRGDPERWLEILDRMEALDLTILVPGHGPLGTIEDIVPFRRYITELMRLGEQLVADGISAEEFLDVADGPEVAEPWAARDTFARNVAFVVEWAREAKRTTGGEVRCTQ